jgi:hypothetical protein
MGSLIFCGTGARALSAPPPSPLLTPPFHSLSLLSVTLHVAHEQSARPRFLSLSHTHKHTHTHTLSLSPCRSLAHDLDHIRGAEKKQEGFGN